MAKWLLHNPSIHRNIGSSLTVRHNQRERERERNAHSSKATRNRRNVCLVFVQTSQIGGTRIGDRSKPINLMFVCDYWFEFCKQLLWRSGRVGFMAGKKDLTRTRIDSTRNYTIYYKPTNPTIHPLGPQAANWVDLRGWWICCTLLPELTTLFLKNS